MKYSLNEKPPFLTALIYGLQWWIVSLPCVIIMGAVIGKMHFTELEEQTLYMQKIFAITGITTIIQVIWGHKLPLIIGSASVLLVGITASLSAGIPVIYTSIIIGGLLVALLAFSGLLTKIRFIFTPRVVTVILILIPFTLMPVIRNLVLNNGNRMLFNLLYTFVFVFSLFLCNKYLKGVWKSTTVLWGIIIGSVMYYCIFQFPNIEPINNRNTVLISSLFMTKLEFDVGTVIAFLFCFFALIINELGSIEAVGQMLHADNMGKKVRNGVGITGLSNILSGSMGVVGSVDYSMSTGVIAAIDCASRYTLIPAGVGLAICAFLPQAVNLLNHIPSIVMGGLLIYLMAGQLSSGYAMMINEKAVSTYNDGIVVGLPVMIAVLISFAPEQVVSQIPSIVKPIIGNGFVMGVITVLIAEHLVFRQKDKNKQL